MKTRLFRFFIAVLILLSLSAPVFSSCAVWCEDKDEEEVSAVSSPSPALPKAFSLVGDKTLPPIDDQGSVSCCTAEAVVYMQFTNAVGKYMNKYYPSYNYKSSDGNAQFIFSPKYVYNFAGSDIDRVYSFLSEQGAARLCDCAFDENSKKGGHDPTSIKSLSWNISDDALMQSALGFRLTGFEKTIIPDDKNISGDDRRAIIDKVKKSLVAGNVVVASGDAYSWNTFGNVRAGGSLGKRNERCIPYSSEIFGLTGYHSVSIVGYDDALECETDGVTLRGAFLVANSWGSTWKNDGCIWLMYDSIFSESEYESLSVSKRVRSVCELTFTDWEKDISVGLPERIIKIEVSSSDRDCFIIELTRTDDAGNTESARPLLFRYVEEGLRPNSRSGRNFEGEQKAGKSKGYFAFAISDMIGVSAEERFDDYFWGARISVTSEKGSVDIGRISLIDENGREIYAISADTSLGGTESASFVFDDDDKIADPPQHEHISGDWVIVTPATTESQGLRVKYCTICSEILDSETIPVLTDGEDEDEDEDKDKDEDIEKDKENDDEENNKNIRRKIAIISGAFVIFAAFAAILISVLVVLLVVLKKKKN